jgi:two-component system sensor histidine kinase DegS
MAQGQAGPEELKVIEEAARRTVDGARALAYGVRNLTRGVSQLENARSYAETMLRAAHCTLSWSEERCEARVAGKVLREVAGAVKEAVNNIVRHAQAKSVRIRVEYPDGRIRVTVQDTGVGFSLQDVRPTKEGRGLGLVGSSERLERIGGVYDVRSVPKRGTLIVMEAPRR